MVWLRFLSNVLPNMHLVKLLFKIIAKLAFGKDFAANLYQM